MSSGGVEEESSESARQLECFERSGGRYSILVTPYIGYEDTVLEIRNRNRTRPTDRAHMDWRYKQLEGVKAARLFWIEVAGGMKIGVAGVVFRKYCVNGNLREMGVLGDIALDTRFRGKGLGKKLFDAINRSFQEDGSTLGLVIPNEMAGRALKATGWETADSLIPYVMDMEPGSKLVALLGNKTAKIVAAIIRESLLFVLRLKVDEEMEFQPVRLEHPTQGEPWERLRKEGLVMRDRQLDFLKWRYSEHPKGDFIFLECYKRKECVAMVVIRLLPDKRTCVIYDFIGELKEIHKVLRALSLWLYREKGVKKLRFVVNERRSFFKGIQRFGFVKRPVLGDVLVYEGSGYHRDKSLCWFITSGDKDV